jgi:hypothetical protein
MAKGNGKIAPGNARIDKLVAQYLGVRKRLAELKEEYEKASAPFVDAKEKLAGRMLQFLDSTGAEMARTSAGTVYVTTPSTASLTDPDAFVDFVREHDLYELMDRRANALACRDFAEQNGTLPPGVKLNSRRTIGVRTS